MLYLSMRVLILLDLSYISRFWTQYEAWLSMQTASADGLRPATTAEQRFEIIPIMNGNSSLVESLKAMWKNRTPAEAYEVLAKPDVRVTNQKDKERQLRRVQFFSDEVSVVLRKMSSSLSPRAAPALEEAPTQAEHAAPSATQPVPANTASTPARGDGTSPPARAVDVGRTEGAGAAPAATPSLSLSAAARLAAEPQRQPSLGRQRSCMQEIDVEQEVKKKEHPGREGSCGECERRRSVDNLKGVLGGAQTQTATRI